MSKKKLPVNSEATMSYYAEEKFRSEIRDRELGFTIESVEKEIETRLAREGGSTSQTWNHLSPQVFQTPYDELARIVHEVDPESRLENWADLGAAYGRLGIVLAQLRPRARFTGIELVPERVKEGRRVYASLGLSPESLIEADLAKCAIPAAELYFIYDFGIREEIGRVLIALQAHARVKPIIVIGRGRGIRDAIEHGHPWLASVTKPIHSEHYSIYRSA
jgi:hypothetical protein